MQFANPIFVCWFIAVLTISCGHFGAQIALAQNPAPDTASKPAPADFTIGVIAPLTGNAAHIGDEITRVTTIIAESLCDGRCRFLIEDGKAATDASPTTAVNKLLRVDGVNVFLVATSGEVLQTAPLIERSGGLLMGVYSGHPDIKNFGDSVFRTFPDLADGAGILAQTMGEDGLVPIAILTEEHTFTTSMSKLLVERLGKAPVIEESFHYDEREFRTLALRLKKKGPAKYYLSCANPSSCANLVLQMRQLNITEPIYSFLHLDNPEFLQAAGKTANGIRFLGTPPADQHKSDRFKRFIDFYQKRFPDGPRNEFLRSATFDGAIALVDCILQGNLAQPQLSSCLYSYQTTGALGKITFNRAGDVVGLRYAMKKIIDGKVNIAE
jgi:ABC-type branched-subunit amino acid transport system substrate-binding protein